MQVAIASGFESFKIIRVMNPCIVHVSTKLIVGLAAWLAIHKRSVVVYYQMSQLDCFIVIFLDFRIIGAGNSFIVNLLADD